MLQSEAEMKMYVSQRCSHPTPASLLHRAGILGYFQMSLLLTIGSMDKSQLHVWIPWEMSKYLTHRIGISWKRFEMLELIYSSSHTFTSIPILAISILGYYVNKSYLNWSRPRWTQANVFASRSKLRGFKPDWGGWIFSERKILEHKSSGRAFNLGMSLRFQARKEPLAWKNRPLSRDIISGSLMNL